MSQGEGPESEVRGGIGDASEDKLDGFDELMHRDFLERLLLLLL